MSIEREITCINKTNRNDPHDRIKAVGGWWGKEDQQVVIQQILKNTHSYYVSQFGFKVRVIVAYNGNNPYIKTEKDNLEPNNLLSLKECL
jgi:hypothetical protein